MRYDWIKFDLFFGAVVILNGALLGVESDLTGNNPKDKGEWEEYWFYLENGFLGVFMIEFLFRWLIYSHFATGEPASDLYFGIVPNWTMENWRRKFYYARSPPGASSKRS